MKKSNPKRVLIIGGGFAGISCARILTKKGLRNVAVTLVSDNPHFEYHATLYRVLTGKSPLESAIHLNSMLFGHKLDISKDRIVSIDTKKQVAQGESGSTYKYDYLVLAAGSVPNFYNTPGLEEHAYTIHTVDATLRLKRHIHTLFKKCCFQNKEDKNCSAHIMIVGGGPAGCEVAGELGLYARKVAQQYGTDPSFVTIDLIHSGPRLMPAMSVDVSEEVRKRLYSLGINIFLNRRVVKEDLKSVFLKDMKMQSKTLIWTAGMKINNLYSTTEGLPVSKNGRIEVDSHLRAKGFKNIFIAGDGADVPTSGMAEPAIRMGQYVAEAISRKIVGIKVEPFVPKEPWYITPIGPNWAAVAAGRVHLYGKLGWMVKRLHDFKVYTTFLPFFDSLDAMKHDRIEWDTSPVT